MEASSFVSKARTAFHSAAAKAEKVFADIKKSDSNSDRGEDSDRQSPIASSPDSVNSEVESKDPKSGLAAEDSNISNEKIIPPTSIMRQLAIAVEAGKKYNSMKDLLASSINSSSVR